MYRNANCIKIDGNKWKLMLVKYVIQMYELHLDFGVLLNSIFMLKYLYVCISNL